MYNDDNNNNRCLDSEMARPRSISPLGTTGLRKADEEEEEEELASHEDPEISRDGAPRLLRRRLKSISTAAPRLPGGQALSSLLS